MLLSSLLKKLKKPEVIVLLGIMVVAIFLRFFLLSSYPPSLYSDEAVNGINTLQALETHQFKVFYPENNGREGLFINVQAFFVWLFGPQAWALRLASGIFGTLTVLGLYFLTKELLLSKFQNSNAILQINSNDQNINNQAGLNSNLGSWNYLEFVNCETAIALATAFFLAVSFWHINFSRIGFRAITAPFWAVWAFYFFFVAQKKLLDDRSHASKSYLPWALVAGAAFGLGVNSYISYRVMPVVISLLFLYLFFEAKKTYFLKDFFVFIVLIILGAFVTTAPLFVHYARVPQDFLGRTSQISIFSSATPVKDLLGNILKTTGMFNVAGDFNQRQNIAGRPELFWLTGLMFLVGVYLACRATIKKVLSFLLKKGGFLVVLNEVATPSIYFFLLTWLTVAALPVVISNEGIPHALRSILMIPPVFILTSLGAFHVYSFIVNKLRLSPNWERLRKIIKASVVIVTILLTVEAYTSYFLVWGEDPKTKDAFSYDYNQRAYEVRDLAKELPKYAVYSLGDIGINVMQFLTDTATPRSQREHNLYYVPRNQIDKAHLLKGVYVTELK